MQLRKASGFRHWIRLHGLDGWQLLGSACLVIGVLGFALLIAHIRPTLPKTNGAYLLQTLINAGTQPTVEPQAQPSASPDPSSPSGVTQAAPLPSASRSGFRWTYPNPSAGPSPAGGTSATASPSPTPSASPTPRPVVHPSAVPTPSPSPRPSIH